MHSVRCIRRHGTRLLKYCERLAEGSHTVFLSEPFVQSVSVTIARRLGYSWKTEK